MKNHVWQLLRKNINPWQLGGYALANLIGLAIVVTALQFYRDADTMVSGEDSFLKRDYLILSKKVKGMGSLLGSATKGFSADEIAEIEAQPWTRRIGEFTASDFGVSATVNMGGNTMSTAMFLESIPTEFFDVRPRDWQYHPDTSAPVPIILSKDYLTLYNFGFASSRGLPQLSESMISMVPLRLSLSGNGRQQWVDARVVGFSSRMNTIAVPEEFMQWANGVFGEHESVDPSRIIVEVNSPGDPAIESYLKEHGYESAGDKVDNGRAAYFLSVVTSLVVAVGAVICLLSFFILLLSIYLLLQKNREKLRNLMMLGYSAGAVARQYYILVAALNATVLVGAVVVMIVASQLWREPLEQLGLHPTAPWVSILAAVAIMIVLMVGNFVAISVSVGRNFPRPQNV